MSQGGHSCGQEQLVQETSHQPSTAVEALTALAKATSSDWSQLLPTLLVSDTCILSFRHHDSGIGKDLFYAPLLLEKCQATVPNIVLKT